MQLRLAIAIALGFAAIAAPAPVAAQGDWTVKRNPFDAGTIRRYKAILARRPHDASALGRLAQLYRRYRSLEKLIGEYEAQLKQKGEHHATLVVLARLHLLASKNDEAMALLERAQKADPSDAETGVLLGGLYERSGKSKLAAAVYERALQAKPPVAVEKKLVHKLATLADSAGDIDASTRYFQRYFQLVPGDLQARLELADALTRHKRSGKAIEVLSEAEKRLKSDPARRIEVIARLGSAYESAGEPDKAIREYRRAIGMTRRGYYIRKELTARIVDIFRNRQELAELTKYYERHWPANRRDHFEWDVMARLYEEIGNQEKAVAAFRKATAKSPHELDTHRRLIRLLETTGREDEALAQYEKVIRIAPGEPRFQLELAERYYRRGKRKKALALLRRLEGRFGGDAGVHSALADLYSRWGEEDLALKAHLRLTRIEPNEVVHLVNLGEQHFQRGHRKKAVATWKRIIARRTPDNYARLGRVYAEHDMTTEALEMYAKAIKQRPKDPKLYRGRATVFERKKQWRRAVDDWQKVYDLHPKKASSKTARAEARRRIVALLKRSGRRSLQSRIMVWKRSFQSNDIDAGYFLVEAYLRQGQASEARQVLQRLLTLDPKDTDAMLALVKVHRLEQRYEDAANVLLKLAKLLPAREREFFNQIAELKTRLNKDQEAIFYAQKALEKSPLDPVAHEQLAERYLEMQQYEKALTALEKTVELAPRNFRAHFSLARLYRNTHRLDKAADLYRRILKRSTDDEVLYKAGRQAISLEELLGSLGQLEKIVSPLAFTFAHKEVYRRILVELYDRYVPALVTSTRTGSQDDRKEALDELSRLGSHGLKPLLEALADERDINQRRIAVAVLGFLGNRGAAAPLVHLARREASPTSPETRLRALGRGELDWDLRISALVAAGRLRDPRTIPDLLELTEHSEVAMREAATFALGMTADRRAIKPLMEALGDNRESVQALACLGLAHVGESRATGRIIAVVGDRKRRDSVRASCAFALGVIGDKQAEATLARVLGEGNDEAQRIAAWALGRMGSKQYVPQLLGAYFGRRQRLRDSIAWALVHAHSGLRAKGNPIAFMDYPTRSGKYDLVRAIAALPGHVDGVAIPADLLVDHEREITEAIRQALALHRDLVHRVLAELDASENTLALGPLTAGISKPSTQLTKTLDTIGRAITPDLMVVAKHADPLVRRRALSVLAKIGGGEVVPSLTEALAASSLEHRIAAMRAIAPLMRRGGGSARQLLAVVRKRLSAGDWREQVAAAEALGDYGRGSDVEALIAAAGDQRRKAFVRQAAVAALGRLKARPAVPALAKAARDRSRAVQEQAVLALRAIGGQRARSALASIRKDPAVTSSARALARLTGNGKK